MSPRLLAVGALAALALVLGPLALDRGTLPAAAAALEAGDATSARATLMAEGSLAPSAGRLWLLAEVARAEGDESMALAALRAAWERAPRDAGLQRALQDARGALPDAPLPVGPVRAWAVILSPEELGVLAAAALAAASAALVLAWRARPGGPVVPAAALTALAALTWAAAADGWAAARHHPIAVVTVDALARRPLPDPAEPVDGEWRRGAELRVIDRTPTLALVEDGAGRRGWVDLGSLAIPDGRTR